MTETLIQSIQLMVPNGNRLELPKDTHLANYAEVKRCLQTAGGKYKRCGFEFTDDAAIVKQRLVGGEAVNDKKKFQFFPTPEPLAKRMVVLSGLRRGQSWLEPSAGQGAIADLLNERSPGAGCLVELMPQNVKVLERKGFTPIEGDFLKLSSNEIGPFDTIVANPPFTKNQDIDHIQHMLQFLKPGGVLVTVAGTSWRHGQQKKQVAFREWLVSQNAEVVEVPPGEFSESGTQIATVLIKIVRTL